MSWRCRVFGHAWDGKRHREGGAWFVSVECSREDCEATDTLADTHRVGWEA